MQAGRWEVGRIWIRKEGRWRGGDGWMKVNRSEVGREVEREEERKKGQHRDHGRWNVWEGEAVRTRVDG